MTYKRYRLAYLESGFSNGWTNYETWVVNLWMDNEEPSYHYVRESAQLLYDEAEPTEHWTKQQRATYALAKILKDEYEEAMPELEGVWADLLGAALSEVNWDEIAASKIEEVDKEPTEAIAGE